MTNKRSKRSALIRALENIPSAMQDRLSGLKEEGRANLERDDFVWHHLLQAAATLGGSKGWEGLIGDESNYAQVTYEALEPLSDESRLDQLARVTRRAKVRYPARKAEALAVNFKKVQKMGGPLEAKKKALAQEGKHAKIAFMRRFKGIGPKYGRNIWMDVYHPDFHQSIALDSRISAITKLMGYDFGDDYAEHEHFYLEIAEEANLQGWEVDRLLYNYRSYFEHIIRDA